MCLGWFDQLEDHDVGEVTQTAPVCEASKPSPIQLHAKVSHLQPIENPFIYNKDVDKKKLIPGQVRASRIDENPDKSASLSGTKESVKQSNSKPNEAFKILVKAALASSKERQALKKEPVETIQQKIGDKEKAAQIVAMAMKKAEEERTKQLTKGIHIIVRNNVENQEQKTRSETNRVRETRGNPSVLTNKIPKHLSIPNDTASVDEVKHSSPKNDVTSEQVKNIHKTIHKNNASEPQGQNKNINTIKNSSKRDLNIESKRSPLETHNIYPEKSTRVLQVKCPQCQQNFTGVRSKVTFLLKTHLCNIHLHGKLSVEAKKQFINKKCKLCEENINGGSCGRKKHLLFSHSIFIEEVQALIDSAFVKAGEMKLETASKPDDIKTKNFTAPEKSSKISKSDIKDTDDEHQQKSVSLQLNGTKRGNGGSEGSDNQDVTIRKETKTEGDNKVLKGRIFSCTMCPKLWKRPVNIQASLNSHVLPHFHDRFDAEILSIFTLDQCGKCGERVVTNSRKRNHLYHRHSTLKTEIQTTFKAILRSSKSNKIIPKLNPPLEESNSKLCTTKNKRVEEKPLMSEKEVHVGNKPTDNAARDEAEDLTLIQSLLLVQQDLSDSDDDDPSNGIDALKRFNDTVSNEKVSVDDTDTTKDDTEDTLEGISEEALLQATLVSDEDISDSDDELSK